MACSDPGRGLLKIFVEGLELPGQIGVHAHERDRTQTLIFDIEIELLSMCDDTIGSTLDYDLVVGLIERILGAGHIQFVETVAQRVVDALGEFPMVRRTCVRVKKPSALGKAKAAGAVLSRTFARAANPA